MGDRDSVTPRSPVIGGSSKSQRDDLFPQLKAKTYSMPRLWGKDGKSSPALNTRKSLPSKLPSMFSKYMIFQRAEREPDEEQARRKLFGTIGQKPAIKIAKKWWSVLCRKDGTRHTNEEITTSLFTTGYIPTDMPHEGPEDKDAKLTASSFMIQVDNTTQSHPSQTDSGSGRVPVLGCSNYTPAQSQITIADEPVEESSGLRLKPSVSPLNVESDSGSFTSEGDSRQYFVPLYVLTPNAGIVETIALFDTGSHTSLIFGNLAKDLNRKGVKVRPIPNFRVDSYRHPFDDNGSVVTPRWAMQAMISNSDILLNCQIQVRVLEDVAILAKETGGAEREVGMIVGASFLRNNQGLLGRIEVADIYFDCKGITAPTLQWSKPTPGQIRRDELASKEDRRTIEVLGPERSKIEGARRMSRVLPQGEMVNSVRGREAAQSYQQRQQKQSYSYPQADSRQPIAYDEVMSYIKQPTQKTSVPLNSSPLGRTQTATTMSTSTSAKQSDFSWDQESLQSMTSWESDDQSKKGSGPGPSDSGRQN